jgi:hypothetical protein
MAILVILIITSRPKSIRKNDFLNFNHNSICKPTNFKTNYYIMWFQNEFNFSQKTNGKHFYFQLIRNEKLQIVIYFLKTICHFKILKR